MAIEMITTLDIIITILSRCQIESSPIIMGAVISIEMALLMKEGMVQDEMPTLENDLPNVIEGTTYPVQLVHGLDNRNKRRT